MTLRLSIAGAVLLVIGLMGWEISSLRNDLNAERAKVVTLTEERDRAREDVDLAADQNTNWIAVAERRAKLLGDAQRENRRIREEGDKAVAAAEAAAAEANRAFDRFIDQFRAKPAECEAALIAMEEACPTLSDY